MPLPANTLSTLYATDEAICIRAGGDWATLVPDWQKLAYAPDGVFLAGTPWVLASATVNFLTAGVQAGGVMHLQQPVTIFKGQGEYLAIDAVNQDGTVSLRRLGIETGVGSPPGQGGVTSVRFVIATMQPQIEKASYQINRAYNIDPTFSGRTPANVYDLRDLEYATVLWVLWQRYSTEARTTNSDLWLKAKAIHEELEDAKNRLTIRWITGNGPGFKETNATNRRILR